MMIISQPMLLFVTKLSFANAAAKAEIRISKFVLRILFHQSAFASLTLLFFCGCAGPRYIAGPRLDDAERARVCVAALNGAYPAEFNTSLRMVLAVRGRRYDFIGYLRMARAGRMHLAAYSDFGGAVFEVTADAAGATVVSKPRGMPKKLLTDGIARDLQHVFGLREAERAQLLAREDGATGLALEYGDGALAEYVFAGDGRLLRSLAARRERVTREAEYDPPRIVIRNHRGNYTLELEVLKLAAGQLDER